MLNTLLLAVLSLGVGAVTLLRQRIIQPPEVLGTYVSGDCLTNIQRMLNKNSGEVDTL